MIRWLKRIALALLGLVASYVVFQLIAWRDLPVEELEHRYWAGRVPESAEISGVDLRYSVEGAGPPVLLIHNHFLNMRMWDGWVETLRDEFTLIRFDMTSHGLTGPDPTDDYSMERSLALISGLLDHLSLERVHIVGSSLGGNMAFHFAARNPERVDRLVLINSGGLKRENSRSEGEIPGWADGVLDLVPRSAYGSFLRWMIVDDVLVTDELVAEFHDMFRRRGNRSAEIERLRDFDPGDPSPVLAAVAAPTLILWGRDNPQLPFELAYRFQDALTGSSEVELRILPGVGHVLPLERPAKSAELAADFLANRPGVHDGIHGHAPGPHRVIQSQETVLTHADGREISARAFYPESSGSFPLIVFSHGFASDKDQYGNLIDHWVSHGYVVLAADHEDSGGTFSAIFASIRLGEIELIDTRITDMALLVNSSDSFPEAHARLQPGKIVAAGHSFGAFTAQMMTGAVAIDEDGKQWGYDGPDVAAVLAVSPPGEMFDVIVADSWKNQRGPVLMTTGTADVDGQFVTDWRQHLLSFENARPGAQYALAVDGADHYLGKLICRLDTDEPAQYEALAMVNMVATAFLDATVKDDETARLMLDAERVDRVTRGKATFKTR